MTIPILIKTSEINEMLSINSKVSIKTITDYLCFELGIDEENLRSKLQTRELVDARYLIFYIAYSKNLGTVKVIGKEFNRNYATVIHGINQIKTLYQVDTEIRNRVDKMEFMFN